MFTVFLYFILVLDDGSCSLLQSFKVVATKTDAMNLANQIYEANRGDTVNCAGGIFDRMYPVVKMGAP